MFNAPEAAIVTEPRLALVKQAGKQYAEAGEIDEELLAEIGTPMIPEEQYAAIVNGGEMKRIHGLHKEKKRCATAEHSFWKQKD